MPEDTHIDLGERVAALEQMLVEGTAERDEAREPAGCRSYPPPRWGRVGVGVVPPRTDPW